jgi:hypothetical protein
MSDLNKNTPAEPKLIEWAFLCASAEVRNDGGWNITNLNHHFELLNPTRLFIFFHCVPNFSRGGIYDTANPQNISSRAPHSEFRFGYIINSNLEKSIEVNSMDLPVSSEYLVVPIGEKLIEPGNYMLDIFADGALQHSLAFFLR